MIIEAVLRVSAHGIDRESLEADAHRIGRAFFGEDKTLTLSGYTAEPLIVEANGTVRMFRADVEVLAMR